MTTSYRDWRSDIDHDRGSGYGTNVLRPPSFRSTSQTGLKESTPDFQPAARPISRTACGNGSCRPPGSLPGGKHGPPGDDSRCRTLNWDSGEPANCEQNVPPLASLQPSPKRFRQTERLRAQTRFEGRPDQCRSLFSLRARRVHPPWASRSSSVAGSGAGATKLELVRYSVAVAFSPRSVGATGGRRSECL
jgi:hypothetical protein